MSRHCKKLERKISKNLGGDRFGVFYYRFLNVTLFFIIQRPIFFYKKRVHINLVQAFMELFQNTLKK